MTFAEQYARLKSGGSSAARALYQEFLALEDSDEVLEWRRFWRGRQFLVDPPEPYRHSAPPELVFLALAEGYAEGNPISLAAQRWLEQTGPERPWLKLRFRPREPVEMPLILEPCSGSDRAVEGVLLDPTGEIVATGRPETAWQVKTGQSTERWPEEASLYQVERKGQTLHVYHEGQLLRRLEVEGPPYLYGAPRISQDGRWVLCLTQQANHSSLRGWELDQEGRVLQAHSGTARPWGSVWAQTERRRVEVNPEGAVELWDIAQNRLLLRLPDVSEFSWSGPWAWTGSQCWDLERGWVAESDQTLAVIVDAGVVRILHKPSGSCLAELFRAPEYVRDMCADRLLVYAEAPTPQRWGLPVLLELRTGLRRRVPQTPAKPAGSKFCNRHLVICNQEGDHLESCPIRIFELTSLHLERRLRLPFPYVSLDATPDARTVAAACSDRLLRVFDCSRPPAEDPAMCQHDATIRALVMTPDGRRLASGSTDKTVRVYDLETGSCLGVFSGDDAWAYPSLSDDGRWLLVSSAHGRWLWDLDECRLVQQGDLELTAEGLVVRLEDGQLHVTRALDGSAVCSYRHRHAVTAFSVSPFGPQVASGDVHGGLHCWDLHSGKTLHKLEGDGTPVRELYWNSRESVQFFPETRSNFWYSWRIGERERGQVCWSKQLPPNFGSKSGRSPDGRWTFELQHGGVLLTENAWGRSLFWPGLAPPRHALFRSDRELIVGMSTGEILSLELMPAGRPAWPCQFGTLPLAGLAVGDRVLVLAASGEADLPAALRIQAMLGPRCAVAAPLAKQREGVHSFRPGGPASLFLRLKELRTRLRYDAIVVVDRGCRTLLRGDEPELANPALCVSTLAAAARLDLSQKMLLACGFGAYPICHAHILEAAAGLTRTGAFLGAYTPPEATQDPLADLWWFFSLDAVAARCRYLSWIAEKSSLRDVQRALANYRSTIRPREWDKISV